MENNYFSERDKNNIIKLREIIRDDLPRICNEFFIGIQTYTTVLTRLAYAQDLSIFFNFLYTEINEFASCDNTNFDFTNLNEVNTTHIEIFMDYLSYYKYGGKEYRNSLKTKARKLSSVKAMFKYFYNKDRITANPASKVPSPKLKEKPIIRLERDEVAELLENIDENNSLDITQRQQSFRNITKKRDIAIITLFLGTGIRISELVGLNIDDIDFKNNAFKLTRKGGAQTILYFTDEVAAALMDYIEEREIKKLLDDYPALFLSLQNKRISVRAVEILVKKYATEVTPLKKITPHKLRSTFGTNLYAETNDIYVVGEILGHKDINTTKRHYAAISEDIKRAAAEKVKLRDK